MTVALKDPVWQMSDAPNGTSYGSFNWDSALQGNRLGADCLSYAYPGESKETHKGYRLPANVKLYGGGMFEPTPKQAKPLRSSAMRILPLSGALSIGCYFPHFPSAGVDLTAQSENWTFSSRLLLLPPDDTILIGHLSEPTRVYADTLFSNLISTNATPGIHGVAYKPAEVKIDFPALVGLDAVYEHAKYVDWDGEGALAVSIEAYRHARAFLYFLPRAAGIPEISAEADGRISFEWFGPIGKRFSVSIGADRAIPYAAFYGHEEVDCVKYGVERFDGEGVPKEIINSIGRLSED